LVATSDALGAAGPEPSTPPAPSRGEVQDAEAAAPATLESIAAIHAETELSAEPPDSRSETQYDDPPEKIEIESELPGVTETVWTHITQAVERLLTRTGGPDEDESLVQPASTPIAADVSDDHLVAAAPFESLLLSDEIAIPESTDAPAPDAARNHEELEQTLPTMDDRPPFQPTPHEASRMNDLDKAWATIGKAKTTPKAPIRPKRDRSKSQDSKGEAEKTILIADDDGDLVQMLALRCAEMGFHVFRSPDAMHALLGVNRIRPDLVMLDVNMPGGNGLSVCEMLAGDESLAKIPVIIMSGTSNEETVRRCRTLHAEYVAKGAGLWERLEPVMRRALGMSVPPPSEISSDASAETDSDRRRPTILCIDDDPEISKILKFRLERYGVDVLRAFNGMQGYWTALDMRPDMIILDMVMPDGSGNYIFGRLRSHPLTEKIPVLMLTGVNTPGVRRQMFALGVDAYLTKPLDFIALLELVRQYVPLCDPKPATEPRKAGDSHKGAVTEFLVAN
jgi:DNA-binding response OmpR family regulator